MEIKGALILPRRYLVEKRKNPERITQESIIKNGRTILGDDADVNNLFFIRMTLDESTREIY